MEREEAEVEEEPSVSSEGLELLRRSGRPTRASMVGEERGEEEISRGRGME